MKKEYILPAIIGGVIGWFLAQRKYKKDCPNINFYDGKYIGELGEGGRIDLDNIFAIKGNKKYKISPNAAEDVYHKLYSNLDNIELILVTNDLLNKYPTEGQ